jgi:hypothetical protein
MSHWSARAQCPHCALSCTALTMNREADDFGQQARQQFAELVDSAGVKRFSMSLGLSTRQVNRMIAGTQPNPVERLIRCLQSGDPEVGDRVLDYICQEMGGHFVRCEALDDAMVNAVKECAEAIAAISDGQICDMDIREIREAISALSAIIVSLRHDRPDGKK